MKNKNKLIILSVFLLIGFFFWVKVTNGTTILFKGVNLKGINSGKTPPTPITGIAAITGTVAVGSQLTAGALTPGGATATYQWKKCDTVDGTYTNIDGATSSTYTLDVSNIGKYIKVSATGTGSYFGTVTSTATSVVPTPTCGGNSYFNGLVCECNSGWGDCDSNPANGCEIDLWWNEQHCGSCPNACISPQICEMGTCVNAPLTAIGAITGTVTVGSQLTAGALTPSGATVTYQWQRADTSGGTYSNISGATSSTYTLTCSDVYKYIKVSATGTGSYTGTVTSSATSMVPLLCGCNFTVAHTTTAGVAPVNKTVTYSTVSTSIGGTGTKCWITQNLGATNQATAVNDSTEASAGWYWQFNRKQGYQYTTSRTPSTAWITSINESLNWQTANDPCTIELGAGWRLPTYTEYYNMDNTGGWTTWTGPWNSVLKVHAAGYLHYSSGGLGYRGSYGMYWTSAQYDATYGRYWDFGINNSTLGDWNGKTHGFSVRCVKD